MIPIRPETMLVRSGELLSTDLDDETVLMSIEAGSYYGMEGTARRIWALLVDPHPLSSLSGRLALEYHVTPEQCLQDILPFLEELQREGLIKVG
jgi:Coenzyme PQQ synthesis protein D (PqqD)